MTTRGVRVRPFFTGRVLFDTVRFGTLENLPNVAVASFRLLDDLQAYPIYAKGIPAIALRRYVDAVRRAEEGELLITVEFDLLASDNCLLAFAAKIHWHVFGILRDQAEKKISADKRHLFDDVGLPPDWPRESVVPNRGKLTH